MITILRPRNFSILVISAALVLWFAQPVQYAQTQSQFPNPSGHINDFAGVLSESTKERLEVTLENLKLRGKVDLYIVLVESTGDLDIFDYSRELSRNWKIGQRTDQSKSLLLVVGVNSKTSFTQFTRTVQNYLPEGVLGEMSQRMRPLLAAGQFADAVDQGVKLFMNSMAQKVGFTLEDIDKRTTVAANDNPSAEQTAPASERPSSRPRTTSAIPESSPVATTASEPTSSPSEVAKQSVPPATAEPTPVASPVPTQTETESTTSNPPAASSTPASSEADALFTTPKKSDEKEQLLTPTSTSTEPVAPKTKPRAKGNQPARSSTRNTAAKRPVAQPVAKTPPVSTPANDEAELEQVEEVEARPLSERLALLNKFLETHPDSKARPRALELIASTNVALGNERLRSGDTPGGVAQLMAVIDEADPTFSDKFFSSVLTQIPINLYMRGEKEAAFTSAQKIETKFGSDPKRLVDLAGFYLRIERGDEVVRLAEQAIKLAPDMAEAHRVLASGLHISLRVDEAANEYKRAYELDANAKGARISLADLYRANAKPEEALTLYREQLTTDPKDKAAQTGMVLSLFELGRKEEANAALEQALTEEPRNLPLLTGAAYWFAAHEDFDKALTYAQKAVTVEPRYTWAQIALARTLIALKRPVDAERSIRYARQYGKFPTLNYELANVLASMGLYEEAAEVLRESFVINDNQIETKLAGRFTAANSSFVELLAPERKASIYQPTAADNATNAKMLKDLLKLGSALAVNDGEKIDEARAETAAREFAGADDQMRVYRQVFGASRLLRNNIALKTVVEITRDAKKNVSYAVTSPSATIATQADEYRDLRARAIASGQVPDVAPAPPEVLTKILNGRLDDIAGWALFNQEKYSEALTPLKRAVATLPEGTPAWRTALWHLGVVNEQQGNNEEALANYIKSYTAGERDPVRRPLIEGLYRKVHGSLDGLEEKLAAGAAGAPAESASGSTSNSSTSVPAVTTEPPVAASTEKPTTEISDRPKQTAEETAQPAVTPPSSTPANTTESPGLSESDLKAVAARARSNVKIRGRILDASQSAIANAVVVLISPSGSVLAATTDSEGRFTFTVAVSEKPYRVIPSKDGYTFSPVDRALSTLLTDQPDINFVGTLARP